MGASRLYDKVMTIFGCLMVFFYLGFGAFFLFSNSVLGLDKFIRYFVGGFFIFYGLYRLYGSILKVRELFFSEYLDDED